MNDLACLDVSERGDGSARIFCLKCQKPVDSYGIEYGTMAVSLFGGLPEVVHTGEQTLIVRCHGEELRVPRRYRRVHDRWV